jgi:hypothetical protein
MGGGSFSLIIRTEEKKKKNGENAVRKRSSYDSMYTILKLTINLRTGFICRSLHSSGPMLNYIFRF